MFLTKGQLTWLKDEGRRFERMLASRFTMVNVETWGGQVASCDCNYSNHSCGRGFGSKGQNHEAGSKRAMMAMATMAGRKHTSKLGSCTSKWWIETLVLIWALHFSRPLTGRVSHQRDAPQRTDAPLQVVSGNVVRTPLYIISIDKPMYQWPCLSA